MDRDTLMAVAAAVVVVPLLVGLFVLLVLPRRIFFDRLLTKIESARPSPRTGAMSPSKKGDVIGESLLSVGGGLALMVGCLLISQLSFGTGIQRALPIDPLILTGVILASLLPLTIVLFVALATASENRAGVVVSRGSAP